MKCNPSCTELNCIHRGAATDIDCPYVDGTTVNTASTELSEIIMEQVNKAMDYEKAYKEALERAKLLIDEEDLTEGSCPNRNACEAIFPELAESEDERTRKELIAVLKQLNRGQCPVDTHPYEEWIAYLEKQKEQKPIEKQDYSGLTDFERAIHRGFLCAGVENVSRTIIEETAKECLAQMKPAEIAPNQFDGITYGMQGYSTEKPAEWSEEDLQHKSWILECLADGERKMPEYAEDFRAAYKWLKSLPMSCPKSSDNRIFQYKPLAGTDIEDAISEAKTIAANEFEPVLLRFNGVNLIIEKDTIVKEKAEEYNRLLSNWKPSEEQMKALKMVYDWYTEYFPEFPALKSLYNDLKALQ